MKATNKLIATLALILTGTMAHAQEIPSTAGGDMFGTDATVSFTIGQVAYTSTSTSTGSELQGVQQPYEVYAVVSAEEPLEDQEAISVFPNPATDHVIIAFQSGKPYSYRLTDMAGHVLIDGLAVGAETKVDLSGVAQASYILYVTGASGKNNTFKIIKH